MKTIVSLLFSLLFMTCVHADTLDLRSGNSEIADSNAIKLTNLSFSNVLYTVTLYINLNGSWSLVPIVNNSSLDFQTGVSEIISSDTIKLSGISYEGRQYNLNLHIKLNGTWQVSNLSLVDSTDNTIDSSDNGGSADGTNSTDSSANDSDDNAAIGDSNHSSNSPPPVATTCAEKSQAFNAYSSTSVSCDGNTMTIVSNTGIPERSGLDEDKLTVGTEAWIGRVPLTRSSSWKIPLAPDYLSAPENNVSIHDPIGITVDGIPILHYAKESFNGEIADYNSNYQDRDTVLLGELDQCGAHAGNGEDYHYHYAPLCMMDKHDPNQPLAYMFDGLPLYFGTAGGTVTDMGGITSVNYGGGRYSNLDYRPEAVKNGSESLDACNAYDINGDGATSGYAYYTSKEAPYTIGCYRAVADQAGSSDTPPRWDQERDIAWSGAEVLITDYYQSQFQGAIWTFMEMIPGAGNNKLAEGSTAVILYRQLTSADEGYVAGMDCWSFRYRLDNSDTDGSNDSVENRCR